jgi:hypothetical protein
MFKFSTTVAEKACAAASKQKEIESMVFFMFKKFKQVYSNRIKSTYSNPQQNVYRLKM